MAAVTVIRLMAENSFASHPENFAYIRQSAVDDDPTLNAGLGVL